MHLLTVDQSRADNHHGIIRRSVSCRNVVTPQLIRVMKLIAIILFTACMGAAARGHSQGVTLDLKNAPVQKVFKEVIRQTGVSIIYDVRLFEDSKPVTINVVNASIEEVISKCLQDQPLDYVIDGSAIVIKKKFTSTAAFQPAGTTTESISPPPTDITGHITNEQGQPLAGASVVIKRTGKGDIANAKGGFKLNGVNNDDIIIISFVGYKQQKIRVGNITDFTIVMEAATNELDKVVVQAYGTTTQRLGTGNITTVTKEQIERQPVMNPLEAIQGRVPGVIVTETSGYASAPVKIEIRGRSVIDGSQPSEPLYIVDGVPLTVLNLQGDSYASGSSGFTQSGLNGPAGGQSPFFSVNPKDIESITVLKDADATAIYGSRGANGVIIITTKKGKAGKAKFDLDVYQGASIVTGRYDLLNTQQYLMMRREAFKNDQATYGIVPGFTVPDASNAYDLVTWDTTRYTDFQKIYWSGTGKVTDVNLSLSGGDKQNTFWIGGSYVNQREITGRTGSNQRATGRFNYTHKSLDQRVTVSLIADYSFAQSDLIGVGGSILEAPDAPAVFNSEGALNWAGWVPNAGNLGNFSTLYQPYSSKTGLFYSSLNLQYEILKGLSFSTRFGYITDHNSNIFLIPIISQNPINNNPTGRSEFGNANGSNASVEPQLDYKKLLGKKGKLNLLTGASRSSTVSDGSTASGFGYANDNLLRSVNNAPIKSSSNASGQQKFASLFARINYNWADEYVLNLSARRDGSSKFGSGKQYGNFWAVGGAWIFTEEKWFKQHLQFLSFGKLRGSYGLTGNDQIGNYGYLTRWSAGNTIPYQSTAGYVPLQHANPSLHWETNYKLEGALALGFFKDRLTISVAWYQHRCGDQLVPYPLPNITGFSYVVSNSPALVQNTGHEMNLQGKIIGHKDFDWSVNFNIGYNRNKLVAFPNLSQSPYATTYVVGQSLSIVHLLHYTGVDPQTGQYTFQDRNHDGQITSYYNKGNNDFYNKDLAVPYDGGFGTDLRYKRLQINLFFYFVKKSSPSADYNGIPGQLEQNQSVDVLDRWQKPGDHARFARFTTQPQTSDGYFSSSDGVYSDGSYLRLRNASLSYDLKGSWLKKAGMQQCMIYARGQNLFTLTHYDGLDPAIPGLGTMPPEKTFTVGIQLSF